MTASTLLSTGNIETDAAETARKTSLAAPIVAGILAGAVAALLVGGLISNESTTTSVLQIGHSQVAQP